MKCKILILICLIIRFIMSSLENKVVRGVRVSQIDKSQINIHQNHQTHS